ncbi:DNA-directed RNA polymerase subunit beta [Sneathia sanguinegens]|uniref:DNA-directed RNA polymerase subunit beta n=1 Tax=Sneathia sanguinegens TaxID=40543 RepID=UPI0023F8CDBC|nr:DNA-directed RNA polymerase subunit beta [Sneathia sanguinegens]MDU4652647.1 DNA-directed RNA polymerase subunit beta [Sneathia sanguinegens]MDU7496490.1 DNA-directed RNA polymerase subunit beta [Sneathia sanguinegens]
MSKLIERYSFGKIKDRGQMPSFLEFQIDSYEDFLQARVKPEEREVKGLEAIFREIFGEISHGDIQLKYSSYEIRDNDEPLNDELECKRRGKTYSGQLKVKFTLKNKDGEIPSEFVHFGEIPIMTDKGSFIINGAERVVVSQLHRAPGITFNKEMDMQTGKDLFVGKIIPYKGTWLEFEVDKKDVLNVKIDRRKKVPATVFMKAIEFFHDNIEIMSEFFEEKTIDLTEIYKYHKDEMLSVIKSKLEGSFSREDKIDGETGEFIVEIGKRIGETTIQRLIDLKEPSIQIWEVKPEDIPLANSIQLDLTRDSDEAVVEIYRKLRPGDLVTVSSAKQLIIPMFTNVQRYDLANVGRYKINKRLKLNLPDTDVVLKKEDVVATVNYIKKLISGNGVTDDIDNLSNRRVRGVGELLAIQIKGGMIKLAKMAKEKMTTIQDLKALSVQSLLNTKPLNALILEFFGSGQLSQFMDQSNPLSELTHKRRISALGPGGLSRDRAGFEVRDVHNSHYGRICPIETPEGPNIGLIASLSTYGKVNKYGFIETPYVKVENGVANFDKIEYLGADEEEGLFIAQADTPIDEEGRLLTNPVCRYDDEIVTIDKTKVDLMDVSPKQLVSVSAALIPFLEHDDANRALMGSNMQRQAVPLLKTEAPLVGTGLERKVAIDSGAVICSKASGIVTAVDAKKIIVTDKKGKEHLHRLLNFEKSNQSMCLHQKPIVDLNEKVKKGQILADGPATSGGDLALGKNILIAFIPWEGYNYEDAILISERLRKDDVLTSLHVEEFDIESRTTKLGDEEITREIPNVSEDALKNLDEHGIIRVGAYVKPDDILVGKVTPKGETEPPAEEKLLRAIFGDKAKDVRDTSLRLPHGVKGTVVEVLELSKENGDDLKAGVNKLIRIYVAEKRKITVGDKISGRHGNKGIVSRILPVEDMPHLEDGTPVDICLNPLGVPSRMNIGQVLEVHLGLALGKLKKHISTPVFDGASEEEVKDMLEKAGFNRTGKVKLIDGRTGQPFDSEITVGYMYILKLHHLVEDKMHARAIGPYSLVTQQPLGGKAQFGGQRLGEMEVWALEAYGASNVLQEMLTVKSDDINGRTKSYEAIVKGQPMPEADAPESFKVLMKEFQSLGLDINLYSADGEKIELDNNVDM